MNNPLVDQIRDKFKSLKPVLNERQRRLWAAAEARALGFGGIRRVVEATGLSAVTVRTGLQELSGVPHPSGRVDEDSRQRRAGGGRKRVTERDPTLIPALEALLNPLVRDKQQPPLNWTCMSAAQLADKLNHQGHAVSPRTVNTLLHHQGYRLQAGRSGSEDSERAERDKQFRFVNARVKGFQRRGQPVVWVGARKEKLPQEIDSADKPHSPASDPGDQHDGNPFASASGVVRSDAAERGWVTLLNDPDIAIFAAETLRWWWRWMGSTTFDQTGRLLVIVNGRSATAGCGRPWRLKLQELANETGLLISVSHLPPGTSRWNHIGHRMHCQVADCQSDRPPKDIRHVVVNTIADPDSAMELRIRAAEDRHPQISDLGAMHALRNSLRIKKHKIHGEWNYSFIPD